MKYSELARELKPYLAQWIDEIIGDRKYDASNTGDLTYIHGTGFPVDDATGNRLSYVVDLQLERDDDSDVVQGYGSAILGGYANQIESLASHCFVLAGNDNKIGDDFTLYYSGAMGQGALVDNDYQWTIACMNTTRGDAQSSRFALGCASVTITSSWQGIAAWIIREDTAWTFLAQIVGIRVGAAETFSYEVRGCVENDGGTTTLLASTVTTIYEDDVSYNCQVVASDGNDELQFQVTDADNSGNVTKWHTHLMTSEVTWAAA